jgi:hypothetical protein
VRRLANRSGRVSPQHAGDDTRSGVAC